MFQIFKKPMEGESKDSVVLPTAGAQEVLSLHKGKTSESDNSEYDSVDSYSEDEQPPLAIKARSKASGLDSHSESESSVILQREEGDGQESLPQKKVDHDEDKKNPQYIPKRGTFYEHDDRTAEDDGTENAAETEVEKTEKESKKKVWQDKGERWSHDRFNDSEQAPKSRAELVAIYGYDIRNEDGPPRARRRRRYGRGPNKYTRNWEDEEAYTKPPAAPRQKTIKKPAQSETEFPPLMGRENRPRTKSYDSNQDTADTQNYKENEENKLQNVTSFERQSSGPNERRSLEKQVNINKQNAEVHKDSRSNISPRVGGTGRIIKPNREIKDSDYTGFTTKTRQSRGVRTESHKVLPPRWKEPETTTTTTTPFIQSQNFTNKNANSSNHQNQVADMEKEINKLSLQEKNNRMSSGGRQGGSVPPMEQQKAGPKRYSSMRQRSLPETQGVPAAAQPTNFTFYPSDYNSTAPPPATTQPILAAPPTALVPPSQVPVSVTSAAPPPQLISAAYPPPPQAYAPQPPPAAFLPPPSFITAPPTAPPPIVSYVSQAPPTFVPGYQGHSFNTVSQPAELYQAGHGGVGGGGGGGGGITYYTVEQQVMQRAAPQKRPKAAIPIVAPPSDDFKQENPETRSQVVPPE